MDRHQLVALLANPADPFGLGCVLEVFGAADAAAGYDLVLATTARAAIDLSGTAVRMEGVTGPEAFATAQTLIVPGYPVDLEPAAADIEVVREAFARGARILSICTGAFLLGAAGILDGRRATTHWRYTELFRRRFPAVRLEPDILYADAGRIITSAGSAAGLDMLMYVLRSDLGTEGSNAVARRLNVAPHRDGGQAQFVPRPVPDVADDRINRLLGWMRDNCRRPLTIGQLASRVAMSPRNFYRHFRAVTGHTPYDWLLRERIGVAMELLEKGATTLERIADAAGFASGEALRVHFQRIVGVAPSTYRRMFAARAAEPGGPVRDPVLQSAA